MREEVRLSQESAAVAAGTPQATYARVEAGERALKGPELVQLADRLNMRASAVVGLPEPRLAQLHHSAPRTQANAPLFRALHAVLELDAYLTGQDIPAPPPPGHRAARPRVSVNGQP